MDAKDTKKKEEVFKFNAGAKKDPTKGNAMFKWSNKFAKIKEINF